MDEYKEQIEFALKNDCDEGEENILNDDSSDINSSLYYLFQNINEAVDEKEGSSLFKSLFDYINSRDINTNSSTTED